jgi:hypothetical protein
MALQPLSAACGSAKSALKTPICAADFVERALLAALPVALWR